MKGFATVAPRGHDRNHLTSTNTEDNSDNISERTFESVTPATTSIRVFCFLPVALAWLTDRRVLWKAHCLSRHDWAITTTVASMAARKQAQLQLKGDRNAFTRCT